MPWGRLFIAAGAFMLAVSPALATPPTATGQTTPPPQTPAVSPDARDPNAIRCIREPVIGSHFDKRVCHTNAEWDAIREADLQTQRDDANRRAACRGSC